MPKGSGRHLPPYIKRIAKHIRERGYAGGDEGASIAAAKNTVERWCRGGGDVKPSTRAKACRALAQWEAR